MSDDGSSVMTESERQMAQRLGIAVRRTVKKGRDMRMNDAELSQAIIRLPEWRQMHELADANAAEHFEKRLPVMAAEYMAEHITELVAEILKQVEALGADPVPLADLRRVLTQKVTP